ncbi:hypothetical protein KC353_g3481 [Hortaea werneckii]|nr:hypothetical protein KC353_g3481 [Hortaea werneckii]
MIEDIKLFCGTDENLGRFGLAAFYFTFSDKQKQSYEDLLRSLVEQLAWKQDSFARLQQAYDSPNRGRPGRDELEKILLLSLRAYDQVFLALDALDESPEENDTRQTMLEQLETLVRKASNVKLLATSREVRAIQESMEILRTECINVADSKVDKDIRKFVASELCKDRRLSRLGDKTTLLIEDTLSARADGMFRWAYCQIQELKKLKSTKPKYIEDILRTLPKTLDETYDRILCAIEERYRPEALTLLRWITYSKSPLNLGELAEAAIIDPTDEGTVDTDNRGEIKDSVDILSGLILIYKGDQSDDTNYTVDNSSSQDSSSNDISTHSDTAANGFSNFKVNPKSKVRLAHFSVKEYLESKRILDGTAKDFHLDAAREHRFLAQSCVTYIIHYSNDTVKSSTREDRNAYPLLQLSANSWYYHSSLQSDGDMEHEIRMLNNRAFTHCWLLHDNSRIGSYELEDPFVLNGSRPAQAIYFACLLGLRKLAELLLARGADVNESGGHYGSALQAASLRGHKDIVELLLYRGADANVLGGYYGSVLQAASFGGYKDIDEKLLAAGADCNTQGGYYANALQAAAFRGSTEVVERLLTAGADANAQGGEHGNALQAAVSKGSIEVVEKLLAAGADVNAQGGYYGNALQAAAFLGYIEVVERLLAAGADVNAQGGKYGNALQAAAAAATRRAVEVVKRLITAGADVNAQGGEYGNALQAAAAPFFGSIRVVEELLDAGADVNAQGGYYGNALRAAKRNRHEEIANMLLAAGAVPMEDDQLSVESEE